MGPLIYVKHLISGSRLPFTAAYFGSITLTLYFAIGVRLSFPFCLIHFWSVEYKSGLACALQAQARRIVPSNLDIATLHSYSDIENGSTHDHC